MSSDPSTGRESNWWPRLAGRLLRAFAKVPLLGRAALFLRSYVDGNPWRLVATHVRNRLSYTAVAHPLKVIWVDPADITWRVRVPDAEFARWRHGFVHGGDWDREGLRMMRETDKPRSMVQRFVDRLPWEDTDLFRRRYVGMLDSGQTVKGQRSMASLVAYYEAVYDDLWRDVAQNGIVGPTWTNPRPTLIEVHIGRDGRLIGTSNGNHRLGMAMALGLQRIPARVATRHEAWQLLRAAVARDASAAGEHSDHPDLADLMDEATTTKAGSPSGPAR